LVSQPRPGDPVVVAGNGQIGVCAVCGAAVVDGEPYLRYRGEYYHAHGCLESGLPALESLASK
jgi:hypothetical protein